MRPQLWRPGSAQLYSLSQNAASIKAPKTLTYIHRLQLWWVPRGPHENVITGPGTQSVTSTRPDTMFDHASAAGQSPRVSHSILAVRSDQDR